MHDLLAVVVAFDAAGDVADAARRQLLFDEFAFGVKEHEIDAAGFVFARHLVGGPRVAARSRLVLQHTQLRA